MKTFALIHVNGQEIAGVRNVFIILRLKKNINYYKILFVRSGTNRHGLVYANLLRLGRGFTGSSRLNHLNAFER